VPGEYARSAVVAKNVDPMHDDDVQTAESDAALSGRRAKVLNAVVAEHIATGQPIGSGHLAGAEGLDVSSATIRSEMSALERDGFLTHPHTSAGRIPTDRGYRFFVDTLPAPAMPEPRVTQVRTFFDNARGELEQLLAETSRMLSNLTDYAAVVVAPGVEPAAIRSVQLVSLGSGGPVTDEGSGVTETTSVLVVIVLANGAVEKNHLFLRGNVPEHHLTAAGSHLTAQMSGRSLDAVWASPILRSTDDRVQAVCEATLAGVRPSSGTTEVDGVFVGGAARMASAFDAVSTIRQVLTVLEEQYVVVNLLREAVDRRQQVSIGAEHGADAAFESLLSCSVVAAPYLVDGHHVGTIGILGPTRMDYARARSAVAEVSGRLSSRLSERQ
jgi:heat-inducible transcriptional repressor